MNEILIDTQPFLQAIDLALRLAWVTVLVVLGMAIVLMVAQIVTGIFGDEDEE